MRMIAFFCDDDLSFNLHNSPPLSDRDESGQAKSLLHSACSFGIAVMMIVQPYLSDRISERTCMSFGMSNMLHPSLRATCVSPAILLQFRQKEVGM